MAGIDNRIKLTHLESNTSFIFDSEREVVIIQLTNEKAEIPFEQFRTVCTVFTVTP